MEGHWTLEEIRDQVKSHVIKSSQIGERFSIRGIYPLESSKAVFTHKQWELEAYWVVLDGLSNQTSVELSKELGNNGLWATREDIQEKYSIASAYKQYRDLVQ